MPKLFYDIYMHMNCAAFVIAIAERLLRGLIARRKLSGVFWMSVFAFGGMGSMMGCFFSRNHLDDGIFYVIALITVLQLLAIMQLEGVF